MAASASWSSVSAVSPRLGDVSDRAMPVLVETVSSFPLRRNRRDSESESRAATASASAELVTFSQTTTNSSPPRRASRSDARAASLRRSATPVKILSPTAWP